MSTSFLDNILQPNLDDMSYYETDEDNGRHKIICIGDNPFISAVYSDNYETTYVAHTPSLEELDQRSLANIYKDHLNAYFTPCDASEEEIERFIKEQNHQEKMQEEPTGTLLA